MGDQKESKDTLSQCLHQISTQVTPSHLGKMGPCPGVEQETTFVVYRVGLLTTQTKETLFSIPVSPTLLCFIFFITVITLWYYLT